MKRVRYGLSDSQKRTRIGLCIAGAAILGLVVLYLELQGSSKARSNAKDVYLAAQSYVILSEDAHLYDGGEIYWAGKDAVSVKVIRDEARLARYLPEGFDSGEIEVFVKPNTRDVLSASWEGYVNGGKGPFSIKKYGFTYTIENLDE